MRTNIDIADALLGTVDWTGDLVESRRRRLL
jgi:hypothetical protein